MSTDVSSQSNSKSNSVVVDPESIDDEETYLRSMLKTAERALQLTECNMKSIQLSIDRVDEFKDSLDGDIMALADEMRMSLVILFFFFWKIQRTKSMQKLKFIDLCFVMKHSLNFHSKISRRRFTKRYSANNYKVETVIWFWFQSISDIITQFEWEWNAVSRHLDQ